MITYCDAMRLILRRQQDLDSDADLAGAYDLSLSFGLYDLLLHDLETLTFACSNSQILQTATEVVFDDHSDCRFMDFTIHPTSDFWDSVTYRCAILGLCDSFLQWSFDQHIIGLGSWMSRLCQMQQ